MSTTDINQPDVDLSELGPLARVIADKVSTVPVRHCLGGTDDLVAELTLAVAVYVGREVLPPQPPAATVPASAPTDASVREQLLDALDFAYCQGLGYGTPEELLAAYDTSRAPADQTALRDRLAMAIEDCPYRHDGTRRAWQLADAVLAVLPEPTNQAAALSEAERTMLTYALDQAQERIWSEDGFTDEDQAAVTSLRRLTAEQPASGLGGVAGETQQAPCGRSSAMPTPCSAGDHCCKGPSEAQQPETQATPCSQPNPCDGDELCGVHEEAQAHAEGEHEHCGPTCETAFPSEQMRNFILAKGYPGTAGMLDELLRRAAATPAAVSQPDEEVTA
ncbi:hypothetical protein [Streptomyces sp. NPDC086182]|uniref:hypothetical protein n=1 Tax=Streptomyces sp. NPDC086182 TaxID=3155058 RepID=UPI0034216A84